MSSFSCLLDCFSYLTGISSEQFIEDLGHDGSEIIYPGLPDPFCRKGFDVFELMDISCFKYQLCSFIPRHIVSNNIFTNNQTTTKQDITAKWFNSGRIIIVMTNKHAVVFRGNELIYDPGTQVTPAHYYKDNHIAIIV